ncbi:NTP hydrolase p-loop-containing [Desulfonema limicola]|uniref:NTP hydrolase p-loop-containing n=1 Tax=Desulfonema limicola TaxID=45656 RepID=A0A975B446_9BACT|nr:hypothetical protein [Desulfonema limicola]QTA78428.1 NTP hydrolase p-loop-containing [Desulfonema limicola]
MSYSDEIVLSFFEGMEEDPWQADWHNHILYVAEEMKKARSDLKQTTAIPFENQTCEDTYMEKKNRWELIWQGQGPEHNHISGLEQGYVTAPHSGENLSTLCKISESLLKLNPDDQNFLNDLKLLENDFYSLYTKKMTAMFCRALVPIFPGKFTTLFSWRCKSVLQFLNNKFNLNFAGNSFLEKQVLVTEGIDIIFGKQLKDQIKIWNDQYEPIHKLEYEIIKVPFAYYLLDIMNDTLMLHKQIIYTGAPGTGKTYLAKKKAKRHINLYLEHIQSVTGYYTTLQVDIPKSDFFFECIQFHPSYGYEDFIEGIRPTGIGSKSNGIDFELTDGSLKAFSRKAGLLEIILLESGLSIKTNPTTGEIIESLKQIEDKVSGAGGWDGIFEKYKTRRGDLFELEKDSIDFWEKYVQSFNHIPDEYEEDEKNRLFSSWLPPFFLIIDEVNRSELSRVFGELMYCFEYRGSEGCIKTQYATLMDKQKKYALAWHPERGSVFFLPHNLYILGTMNNIDRSVETFDLALRRRFYWDDKKYNGDILRMILQKESKGVKADNNEEQDVNKPKLSSDVIDRLIKKAKSLNEAIEKHDQLGTDYQIGHAYFTRILKYASEDSSAKQYNALWEHHLNPLLKEYVRGIPQSNDILKALKSAYDV